MIRNHQLGWALGVTLTLAAGAQTAPAVATGQNIAGTVTNLTTGAPLAHSPVSLVMLQNGMQTVATTTTSAAGHYRFSQSTPGPYLVEAVYQNVPYFAPVTPGQGETNVKVYDAVNDAKFMQVDAEILVLQPDQGQLAVVNEYRIENGLQPPRTLAAQGGMFHFRVPEQGHVDMVRVVGPGELPLAREAAPTAEHDVFTVDSPLRPGETKIQVSYRVPYPALRTVLTETPVTAPAHFEVYVPTAMSFDGAGFTQVGSQDGYIVYGVAGKMPDTFSFQVSGDAPLPPAANASATGGASAGGAASAETAGAEANAGASPGAASGSNAAALEARAMNALAPARTYLEKNLWIVLAVLGLGAAAGFGFLLSRGESRIEAEAPVAVAVAMATAPASLVSGAPIAGLPAPPPPPPKMPSALPSGNLRVASALPAAPEALSRLKDDLFLLEVRLHTGNIDEAEYARLRAEINLRINKLSGR